MGYALSASHCRGVRFSDGDHSFGWPHPDSRGLLSAAQIIDTLEIFHFKRQRKLSLRFLASFLLGIKIQSQTHNRCLF